MSTATARARLAALALSCAWGIIAMSTSINAFVKSNDQKRMLMHEVPAAVSVNIDGDDVLHSGIVLTVICALIALVSFLSLLDALLSRTPSATHKRAPRAGALALAFLSVWLFATLIPFTDFVANRAAKVSATLGGTPLSPAEIQAYQDALGLTTVYHKLGYLVTGTVLPWITLLFTSLASLLSFIYARQASRASVATSSGAPGSGFADEKAADQRVP